jgi:thiol-disulfide isomerase/thioredoxin
MTSSVIGKRLTLDLTNTGTVLHTMHDAVEDVVGRGPTALMHDQVLLLDETRITAEYAPVNGFAIGFMLPFRVVSTTIRYVDANGESLQLVQPNIHHRNETLTNFGDAWLWGHVGWANPRWQLDVRAGVTLPFGRIEDNPYVLGDLGLPHEHIQFGTGTVNPLLAIEAHRVFPRWRIGAWALALPVLYANRKGYQAGDRYLGGVVADSPLGTRKWLFSLGVDLVGELPERWDGKVQEDEGNRGRFDVLLSTGWSWQVRRAFALNANVKIPLYTYVVGGQIMYPLIGTIGMTGLFDFAKTHDHEHDHADDDAHDHAHAPAQVEPPPDWSGLDLTEWATHGESVELPPVAGKITVYDFWAPWCVPCKEVDRGLNGLARNSGTRLAVRKVNIVDWDSPAAARWLMPGKFSLPHLVVYRAGGTLAFARSDDPAALIRAVRELLSGRR